MKRKRQNTEYKSFSLTLTLLAAFCLFMCSPAGASGLEISNASLEERDKDADMAFVKSLRDKLRNDIEIVEIDAHVNDAYFAESVALIFKRLMANKTGMLEEDNYGH